MKKRQRASHSGSAHNTPPTSQQATPISDASPIRAAYNHRGGNSSSGGGVTIIHPTVTTSTLSTPTSTDKKRSTLSSVFRTTSHGSGDNKTYRSAVAGRKIPFIPVDTRNHSLPGVGHSLSVFATASTTIKVSQTRKVTSTRVCCCVIIALHHSIYL